MIQTITRRGVLKRLQSQTANIELSFHVQSAVYGAVVADMNIVSALWTPLLAVAR